MISQYVVVHLSWRYFFLSVILARSSLSLNINIQIFPSQITSQSSGYTTNKIITYQIAMSSFKAARINFDKFVEKFNSDPDTLQKERVDEHTSDQKFWRSYNISQASVRKVMGHRPVKMKVLPVGIINLRRWLVCDETIAEEYSVSKQTLVARCWSRTNLGIPHLQKDWSVVIRWKNNLVAKKDETNNPDNRNLMQTPHHKPEITDYEKQWMNEAIPVMGPHSCFYSKLS